MHRNLISLIILFSTFCYATDVYIDTDVSGGNGSGSSWENAYSTTAAAVVAKAGELAEDINFYARASSGTPDTSRITVSGYTQGVYYLNFYFDDSYQLNVTNVEGMLITGNTTNIRINGLNCNPKETGTGHAVGIYFAAMNVDTNNIYISDCTIIGDCNGTGYGHGIYFNDAEAQKAVVSNCVISNFISGGDVDFSGIKIALGQLFTIYNCTIEGNYFGIKQGVNGIPYTVTNCAIFNSSTSTRDIVEGDPTVTYTATDQTIAGTGNIDWDNGATDWAANFTDYANNDYTIKDINADIYHAGTNVGLSTDITGYAWYTTPSIGAYEFQESSGTPPVRKPRIININMN